MKKHLVKKKAKKVKKHLRFYEFCMEIGELPAYGLCVCAKRGYIDNLIWEEYMIPLGNASLIDFTYWGYDGKFFNRGNYTYATKFTPLRQTIVLLMAAIKGEL